MGAVTQCVSNVFQHSAFPHHATGRPPAYIRPERTHIVKKSRILAAVAAAGIMAATAVGGAQADPNGAPTFRALAGVGSDTTQDVLNALSEVVAIGGVKQIGSYDATGALISTKATANCTNLTRPNGSNSGRAALLNALTPGNAVEGCYQFARSSSLNQGNTGIGKPQLTYIPYAFDDLGYAVLASSNIPKDLTKVELQAIYNCEFGFKALIPQSGSGTRSAWLTYLGITEAQVTARPCISSVAPDGSQIQEHNGLVLDNDSIVPYSVGKWLQQSTNSITDVHGDSVLGKINGGLAAVPSSDFDGKRAVYNVIATAQEGNAPYSTVFVGPSSLVCSNTSTITNSGFAPNPNCGSTALKTAP